MCYRCLAAGLLECPQFTKAESISTLAITLAMRNAALAVRHTQMQLPLKIHFAKIRKQYTIIPQLIF